MKIFMVKKNITRGYGLLENFFAHQRTKKATRIISAHNKTSKILDIGCGIYPYMLLNSKCDEKFGINHCTDCNKKN